MRDTRRNFRIYRKTRVIARVYVSLRIKSLMDLISAILLFPFKNSPLFIARCATQQSETLNDMEKQGFLRYYSRISTRV